jgi:hypothetical protein
MPFSPPVDDVPVDPVDQAIFAILRDIVDKVAAQFVAAAAAAELSVMQAVQSSTATGGASTGGASTGGASTGGLWRSMANAMHRIVMRPANDAVVGLLRKSGPVATNLAYGAAAFIGAAAAEAQRQAEEKTAAEALESKLTPATPASWWDGTPGLHNISHHQMVMRLQEINTAWKTHAPDARAETDVSAHGSGAATRKRERVHFPEFVGHSDFDVHESEDNAGDDAGEAAAPQAKRFCSTSARSFS